MLFRNNNESDRDYLGDVDIIHTTDEIRSLCPYKISDIGMWEVEVREGREEIHQYFNIDENFNPVNDFESVDFDFDSYLQFTYAVSEGDMKRALNYVDSVISPPTRVDAIRKQTNIVSAASTSIEYPFLDLHGPKIVTAAQKKKKEDCILLNPSKGTIHRINEVEAQEYQVVITPAHREDSYDDYVEEIEAVKQELGWRKATLYKKWSALDQNKLYYCGFSAGKASRHVKNFYGFELNPLFALKNGVNFSYYEDYDDKIEMKYDRGSYIAEETYYKSHEGYHRYCPDALTKDLVTSKRFRSNVMFIHNVLSSFSIPINHIFLENIPYPCDYILTRDLPDKIGESGSCQNYRHMAIEEDWQYVASPYYSGIFEASPRRVVRGKGNYLLKGEPTYMDDKNGQDILVRSSIGQIVKDGLKYCLFLPAVKRIKLKDLFLIGSQSDVDMWTENYGTRVVRRMTTDRFREYGDNVGGGIVTFDDLAKYDKDLTTEGIEPNPGPSNWFVGDVPWDRWVTDEELNALHYCLQLHTSLFDVYSENYQIHFDHDLPGDAAVRQFRMCNYVLHKYIYELNVDMDRYFIMDMSNNPCLVCYVNNNMRFLNILSPTVLDEYPYSPSLLSFEDTFKDNIISSCNGGFTVYDFRGINVRTRSKGDGTHHPIVKDGDEWHSRSVKRMRNVVYVGSNHASGISHFTFTIL